MAEQNPINNKKALTKEQKKALEKRPPPKGFKLRHTLTGHSSYVFSVAWSPDGHTLASGSDDRTIRLWESQSSESIQIITGHIDPIYSVAWSPNGHTLASGSGDNTIRLWELQSSESIRTFREMARIWSVAWSPDGHILASGSDGRAIRLWGLQSSESIRTLWGHSGRVWNVAWSPDGHTLASGSDDRTIRLWGPQSSESIRTLWGHRGRVRSVAWSPDGRTLASGSDDRTICLWNFLTGQCTKILEEHTETVEWVSFSPDGRLLGSKSDDGTVRLWRTDTWECVSTLNEYCDGLANLSFHPTLTSLATFGGGEQDIRIWDLDIDTILNIHSPTSISYTNAKVVLLGDSGVGKSGLGLVLSGQPFALTESTHARHVWKFDEQEIELDERRKETRETLLWDLAGQPGYRLIHQLHLNEVAVALVVFDAHSETDPFAGVYHWNRALRQAQRVQGSAALPLKKILVQARVDRGGVSVSPERVQALIDECGFDAYFETSARENWHISDLRAAICQAIDWDTLPKVSSTLLFKNIKSFLIAEKASGRYLSTVDDLYSTFLKTEDAPAERENLYAQFETCIGRVEAANLIKRLSFGKLVLLQPELLDAYASALINAVRDEPDGLGSIEEEHVRTGDFRIPQDERIKDKEQEKWLLLTMIEDMVRRELALREEHYLVFPSQSTRENPDLPDPDGKAVIFTFEGPILNIYATLAVRLSHSGLFKKKDLWKNAITYTATVGGQCGLFLRNIGEGRGELTLFFDKNQHVSEETRFYFEEFVQTHFMRKAIPETLKRRRIFACNKCGFIVPDQLIRIRNERSFNWLDCPGCDNNRIQLLDHKERISATPSPRVMEMDRAADEQRDREAAKSTIQGKEATMNFDVFLCHNSIDKSAVKKIAEQLKEQGLLPWLDVWELRPGLPWQRALEERIEHIQTAAVFVGKDGIGPWQQMELEAFLREFVSRGCPVIPVLLDYAPKEPQLPVFLRGMTWVDFRKADAEPLENLIWGITGRRKSSY
jgi:WD40 repeat protein